MDVFYMYFYTQYNFYKIIILGSRKTFTLEKLSKWDSYDDGIVYRQRDHSKGIEYV